MSFNVLVIPEDCHKDQHVLSPIITRVVRAVIPKARVKVCTDPRLRGVGQATKWDYIGPVVERYRGFVQLFLVVVDRDGDPDRQAKLAHLGRQADALFGDPTRRLIGAEAWQEVEVWILAGMTDLPRGWSWRSIRADANPKEGYFEPYARQRGLAEAVAGGRKALAREAAGAYERLRQRSPEVAELEERIRCLTGR